MKRAYDQFLPLNPELMEACTSWQMRRIGGTQSLNDHRDPAYDGRVLDRLADVDRAIEPVLASLSGALFRFGLYRPRLAGALARAEAGMSGG